MGRTSWLRAVAVGCIAPGALTLRKGRAAEIHSSCHTPTSFEEFVHRYGRDYVPGTDEYNERALLYAKRLEAVNKHNCDPHVGHTWRARINNLADWTDQALAGLSGTNITDAPQAPAGLQSYSFALGRAGRETFPTSVSWQHLPAIRRPRHQGHCGSCWALTAVTVTSAHLEMRNRTGDISFGQVVACTPNPHRCGGRGGCHGATAGLAFNYLMHAGFASSESFPYPYGDPALAAPPGAEGLACPPSMAVDPATSDPSFRRVIAAADGGEIHSASRSDRGRMFGMIGWKRLAENREETLVKALVEEGPVAVSISTGPGWHMYGGGVFASADCDPHHVLRHANVLFGYGVDEDWSLRYWHLKNSWGADWGEMGNMRLERLDHEEAACGWDWHPSKGSECAGGRSRIWVCGSCGLLHEATLPMIDTEFATSSGTQSERSETER